MKKNIFLLLTLLTFLIAGCQGGGSSKSADSPSDTSNSQTTEQADKLQVMTTFYPMYAFTKEITGDLADVSLMVQTADVHGYEPSAQDIAKLQESDAFVYANPEMETFVPALLENVDQSSLSVIEADSAIDLLDNAEEDGHDHAHDHEHAEGEEGHSHDHEGDGHDHEHGEGEDGHTHDHEGDGHDHEHGEGEEGHSHDHGGEGHDHSHAVDPHTWLDPHNAIKQVQAITDSLVELDPDHEKDYRANAEAFIEKLEQLSADYDAALTDTENNIFITQHAAFGYLAHRYNLQQESLAGLSSETEASAQRMAEVVDLIKDHNIPYVFYNSTENSDLAETVAKEAGVETALLYSMEYVEDDSLSNGEGYIQLMTNNLEALSQAVK